MSKQTANPSAKPHGSRTPTKCAREGMSGDCVHFCLRLNNRYTRVSESQTLYSSLTISPTAYTLIASMARGTFKQKRGGGRRYAEP